MTKFYSLNPFSSPWSTDPIRLATLPKSPNTTLPLSWNIFESKWNTGPAPRPASPKKPVVSTTPVPSSSKVEEVARSNSPLARSSTAPMLTSSTPPGSPIARPTTAPLPIAESSHGLKKQLTKTKSKDLCLRILDRNTSFTDAKKLIDRHELNVHIVNAFITKRTNAEDAPLAARLKKEVYYFAVKAGICNAVTISNFLKIVGNELTSSSPVQLKQLREVLDAYKMAEQNGHANHFVYATLLRIVFNAAKNETNPELGKAWFEVGQTLFNRAYNNNQLNESIFVNYFRLIGLHLKQNPTKTDELREEAMRAYHLSVATRNNTDKVLNTYRHVFMSTSSQ